MNVMPDISAKQQAVDDSWYKDAIIYQLHVKAFADSNGDGIGDFNGLTQRLDYLQELGVTALWLLPFYPSPGRDDGYDIADYGDINPDFGTMKDFRRFMAEAKRRNLRVITELVVNHTSDQHAWFKRARRSPPGSSARNWYVWSDTDQKYQGTRIIFTDTEKSNWTWDTEADAYYWHRFFAHQPDLNFDNPRVVRAVVQVMKRWLDAGVDGFRLDAVPYLCERDGTNNENLPETHAVIKKLRAELDAYAPGKVLLAEANQWPEDVQYYFGEGDECHMAYHFPLMPRIYMAIAQEDRFPITDILRQTPDIPANCQWALFLRNHDELTLEMVTDSERDYLWSAYAADPRARINLGIRRRLAPLMDNDRRKIELMNSLLLSFPGTPILYYGDEIGMGDNIYLGDRNGGFSRCDPARLYLPPIMDPVYGYQAVNVEAQSRNISSLLSWTKRLIAVRKTSQVFGRGSLSFIRSSNRALLCYIREYNGEVILCVANLSRSAQAAELDLSPWKGRVAVEMLGRTNFGAIGERLFPITLAPYGFFWLLLCETADNAGDTVAHVPEWVTLVFSEGWRSLGEGRTGRLFEYDVLPSYLSSRRWFAHKHAGKVQPRLAGIVPWLGDDLSVFAVVDLEGDATARYAVPLAVQWRHFDRMGGDGKTALIAPVRRTNREGLLIDALSDRDVIAQIVRQIHADAVVESEGKKIVFQGSPRFIGEPLASMEDISPASSEQSNSTILIDNAYVLKFYRRLSRGLSPEVEIGRFLTDVAGYPNTPALLGSVEYVEGEERYAVAAMHAFVENQGDAWQFTTAYLARTLDDQRLLTEPTAEEAAAPEEDRHAGFIHRVRLAGQRVGEMHAALAGRGDIPDFAPEPITADDIRQWTETLAADTEAILDRLAQARASADERTRVLIDDLTERRDLAMARIRGLLPAEIEADKIRHHGDLHLGQILIVKDDIFIVDFEGEPNRGEAERRRKAPAARDVAGMIRSFDYAAVSALRRLVNVSPEEQEKLRATLEDWKQRSSAAFYEGARDVVSGARLWPRDAEAAQRLLRFFTVEKAIYEIGYELANRPDWLAVPLSGASRAIFGREGELA